jgi:putative ABC transport system permease protein
MNDLKFAFRQLLKNPGFTAVAVLTLALGIGANTAMYSMLNALLFHRLQFPESGRLVRLFGTSGQSQGSPHSVPNFLDYREMNHVLEGMAAYTWALYSFSEPGEPVESLRGLKATSNFFPTLRAKPLIGRFFSDKEEDPGTDQVAVLSESCWRHRFAANTNIIGQTLRLNSEPVTVIGVLPEPFECGALFGSIDVWRPLVFTPVQRESRAGNWVMSLARLKEGVSIDRAQAELSGLAKQLAVAYPAANQGRGLCIAPLRDSAIEGTTRRLLWLTAGLTAFVLLIACANGANLQLIRASARAREFAVRTALGAGRARLTSQLLTESVLLSLLGAAVGLLLAWMSNHLVGRHIVLNGHPGIDIPLDGHALGFTFLTALASGLVFGTAPVWFVAHANVNIALQGGSRGGTTGSAQHRLRHLLVVGEIAFALVLLTGASLFIRGLDGFLNRDPGWRVDGVMTARFNLPVAKYPDDAVRTAFFTRLEERLTTLQGIEHAAVCWDMPTWRFGITSYFDVEGEPAPPAGQRQFMLLDAVSPDFFETIGIRLQKGRVFTRSDTSERPAVIIVNESTARRFWPGEDPIGKRIGSNTAGDDGPGWQQVVGVVNDVRFPGNPAEPETRLQGYRPLAQAPRGFVTIALRTTRPANSVAPELRRALAEIDPGIPLLEVTSARAEVDQMVANLSLLGSLLAAFGAMGLALAAVGIYGVISYSVTQRTREMGIRLALGAQTRDVIWVVLRQGLWLSAAGLAVGSIGAFMVARLLAATVPEIPLQDVRGFTLVALTLVSVALLACWLPAWRGSRIDPMIALRQE